MSAVDRFIKGISSYKLAHSIEVWPWKRDKYKHRVLPNIQDMKRANDEPDLFKPIQLKKCQTWRERRKITMETVTKWNERGRGEDGGNRGSERCGKNLGRG